MMELNLRPFVSKALTSFYYLSCYLNHLALGVGGVSNPNPQLQKFLRKTEH